MKMVQDKGLKKLIISVGFILMVFYAFLLIAKAGVLVFWGDGADQYVQFTTHAYQLIRSNDLSFWINSIGLGANVFTMFFTVLGSPSFYFMLLCPTKEYLVYAIAIIDVLRFFVVAIIAYFWLSKLIKDDLAKVIAAIAFTFSGWMMFWLHFPYYMDMFIYLAALLYLCEEILENRKNILFSILIALLGILSIYQLYMVSWFVFIYLMCRYFMKNRKFNYYHFLKSVGRVFGYYILGIGIGAIVLVPTITILLNTNRVSLQNANFFSLIGLKDVIRTITSLISPISNDFDYNLYVSSITNGISDGNTVYSFTTLLFVLLIPQLFKIKFEGKKVLLLFTGLLYASLLFKFSYFLFNGNESIRWSFFITIFNCLILAFLIENRKKWNLKLLFGTLVSIIGIILVLVILGRNFNLISSLNRQVQKYLVPALLLILIAQFIVIYKKKDNLLIAIATIEVLLCILVRMFNGSSWIIAEGKEIWYYQSLIYRDDVVDTIKSLEDENDFYRIEFNDTTNVGHNLPLSNLYNGFTSYISIFNTSTYDFLENRFGAQWYFGYQPSKTGIKTILGDRYLVTNDGDTVPYEYDVVTKVDNKVIYKNRYSNSFGYATDKVISKDSIKDESIFIQDYTMMQGIIVDYPGESFEYVVPVKVNFDKIEKKFITETNTEGYYYIDYSQDDPNTTCSFDMYYGSAENDTRSVFEIGYQSLKLNKEYNDIFAYCTSQNNPAHYSDLDIYWVPFTEMDILYSEYTNAEQFYDINNQGDYIEASISISNNQKVATTNIAYDVGWTVYDNGIETNVLKTNLGFVGFELDEGTHHIEMRYKPPGFFAGMIVSLISLGTMMLLKMHKKRKKVD